MRTVPRLPPRGGATGVTPRWHPYHAPKSTPSITPASSCSSPPSPILPPRKYLNTPVSTIVSSSDSFAGVPRKLKKSSTLQSYYLNHKERQDAKRAQKEKFETALKELAVQRLADIWKETSYVIHSTSTPSVGNLREIPDAPQPDQQSPNVTISRQLPSPLTPTTQAFSSPPPILSKTPSTLAPAPRRIPLRAFVHEVLRRSKTMWPALQIALCYLDAAKAKVPSAIAEAKEGEGLSAAEATLDRLFGSVSATELNGDTLSTPRKQPTSITGMPSPTSTEGDLSESSDASEIMSTSLPLPPAPAVPPVDADPVDQVGRIKRRRTPLLPVTPLPPRPSPLLCPRRMFVAALILATKFTQDRVYSNRAWAKISGLDAREIGRCERALGEALEWRLWVGKGVTDEPTSFLREFLLAEESLAKSKASGVARSKSDGALLSGLKEEHTSGISSPSWSPDNTRSSSGVPFGDLSSALKRTSSLANNLFSSSPATTPMLSDHATLVLTPANADLDAMDPTPLLQHSTCSTASSLFSFDSTPSSSFSSNEFSFTPAISGIPTPQQSTTDFQLSDYASNAVSSHAASYGKHTSGYQPIGFDPVVGFSRGVEGTFDMGIEDIDGYF